MTFNDLGLSKALVKAVTEKGYTKPSPIQEKAIPHIIANNLFRIRICYYS